MSDTATLAILIFAAAILYSSVGHAGASGYLAAMSLMGVSADVMKPSALVLNIIVATIATIRFSKAGCFSWPTLWPFVISSVPLSFVGGAIQLPSYIYMWFVGAIVLYAGVWLAFASVRPGAHDASPAPIWAAILAGAVIGLLSGLTGTGGGIFLSPLLLFMGWAGMRESAGLSAAFVLVNSIAGLVGNLASVQYLSSETAVWALTAAAGAVIGAELGSRQFAPATLRYLLALVLVVAGFRMILP
jgi:uncharacterized membrane protein YfcA